MFKRHKAKAV